MNPGRCFQHAGPMKKRQEVSGVGSNRLGLGVVDGWKRKLKDEGQ